MEAVNTAPSLRFASLTLGDQDALLPTASQNLRLPGVQSLLSAKRQRESSPGPPREETLSLCPPQRESLAAGLDYRLVNFDHTLNPMCLEEESGATEPRSLGSMFSIMCRNEARDKWQNFSLAELVNHLNKISGNRPPYAANKQDDERRKVIKRASLMRKKRDGGITDPHEQKKMKSKEKHAEAERCRRERLKLATKGQYESVCDFALEMAGFPLDGTRPLTKEVIMDANLIHGDMSRHMDRWKDQILNPLLAFFGNGHKAGHRLLVTHEEVGDRSTSVDHDLLPYRTAEHGTCQHILGQERPASQTSATTRSVSSMSSHRSLSTMCESFDSTNSRPTKRKWEGEEDEDDITPTGPLRHGIARQSPDTSPSSTISPHASWCSVRKSPDTSPRSATSSHGSWCFVQR